MEKPDGSPIEPESLNSGLSPNREEIGKPLPKNIYNVYRDTVHTTFQ